MGAHGSAPRLKVWRIDYKTLVAAIGVIVALAVLVVVLDDGASRRDNAAALARRDEALNASLRQSEDNNKQLTHLIDLVAAQKDQIDALRRQLTKLGIKPVDVKAPSNPTTGSAHTGGASAPGSGSTAGNGSGSTGSAGKPTSKPSPGPTSKPSPTTTHPAPTPTPTKTSGICVLIICVG